MSHDFDSQQGLIYVPVRIWGAHEFLSARLALDTGASNSLVNAGLLRILAYDPAGSPERVRITTASGVEYAPRLPIMKIEALGQARLDFPMLSHTLPPSAGVDGLLGLDFLRGTRLAIDFRAGRMTLE